MEYETKKKELDLMQFLGVIFKRKWMVVIFVSTTVIFTGIFSFLATPMYKSTTTLLIEEGSSKMLSIDESFYQSSMMRDWTFFNTQLRLFKSKSLAERVARKMNLASGLSPSGTSRKKNLITLVKDFLTLKWLRSKNDSDKEESTPVRQSNPYSGAASSIQGNIEVRPIRNTNLVEVSYSSSNPHFAAEIVNTLAAEFINFSVEKRYETTQQASDFLSEEIAKTRDELETTRRELQRFGEEEELFVLSDPESTAVDTFSNLNTAYTQARIDRINAQANYQQLKELDVDSLPPFAENATIQSLKSEYLRLKNQYDEMKINYKEGYSEMVQLKTRIDNMKLQLQTEIKSQVDAAEAAYREASNRELSLKREIDRQRRDVTQMDSNTIRYHNLRTEIDNKQSILNTLIARRNEALVSARLEGLKTSNITIVDPAEAVSRPFSPKKKLNLILAFFIGIVGGVSLCFILEYLDNTIKGPEEVEKMVGLPSLGVIPYLPPVDKKKKSRSNSYLGHSYSYGEEDHEEKTVSDKEKEVELINYLYPQMVISEDYKTVRTSILLSHAENIPKTMVFSSAMPKEGKSATAANMAVSFSQLQKKVLIIDADLRKPRLHRIFKVRNKKGLSGYLVGRTDLNESIQVTSIENIWILPSGPIPPNPAELLNSKKMGELLEEAKNRFDFILIDSPPVVAVIDPVIISTLADCMIFVIKAEKTMRKPFLRSIEELKKAKANIIGIVFNELKTRKGDYYFMDYYRYYRYDYYAEGKK